MNEFIQFDPPSETDYLDQFNRQIERVQRRHNADMSALLSSVNEMQAMRASVAKAEAEGQEFPGEYDLISVETAALRFRMPQDTVRSWLREDDEAFLAGTLNRPRLGLKVGGRWRVSHSRMKERLRYD